MFKKTDTTPQYELFSTPSTQLGKRGSKKYDDPNAWHNQFYRNVTSKIDESIFSPLLKTGNMGAPNASIRVIIGMSLIKEGFGCSDEDLFDKCEFDLLVRKALGLVSLSDATPSLDTYYLLRRRICQYEIEEGVNLMEKCFAQLTSDQLSQFKISCKSVRMDSKLIGSNIAWYSRFEIIHNTFRHFLKGLAESRSTLLNPKLRKLVDAFEQEDAQKIVYRLNSESIKAKLSSLGLLIYQVLKRLNEKTIGYDLLHRVFHEQYEVVKGVAIPRPKEEISAQSVQNHNDPDTPYRKKDDQKIKGYSVNQHLYHVEVAEIIGKEIVIPITEFALDDLYELIDPPVIGDEIVQFGNSRDKTRQSVIYLHADEGGQPAIDLMFDVDSKDWTGKVKVSVGGEIPNSNGQRGFYSVNGLIKSVNAEGQTIYEFAPNGAVNIGNGSIVYDPDTKRLVFGKDVVLTWDNLDEDTKENLKGEDGKDAIVYELMPDVQIIALSKDGSFKPSYVQCGVKKTVGNTESILSAEEIVSEGLGLFCVKDDSGFISINPADKVYPNDDLVNIVFYLRRDELILDSKTLPIIIEGKNGLSVFATYHDSEEEPARPTGEGIDNGWHTDQTAHVWWMSQKAATSASEGIWGEPIRIRGLNGKDANLLPWVQEYEDNKTLIGGEYVISPKMFSGTSRIDENKKQWLTGVAMGRDCLTEPDGTKRTGIFALVDNEVVFELDPISKKYVFRGTIYADAGEFAGTVKGVSGSFKSLDCINKKGDVVGGIELGDDGKMWFSGDMYHQGYDEVNKRPWIFYTGNLFCRDEFGHARMTSLVIDSNNVTDFYVYLDEKPALDAPANHIWSGVSGMPVDCLVLRGQGDYVIRI